jgi:hypothetical protein
MDVVEIIYPGTWLDLADQELSRELEGMLRCLEDRVVEAATALWMYQESRCSKRETLRAPREQDSALPARCGSRSCRSAAISVLPQK